LFPRGSSATLGKALFAGPVVPKGLCRGFPLGKRYVERKLARWASSGCLPWWASSRCTPPVSSSRRALANEPHPPRPGRLVWCIEPKTIVVSTPAPLPSPPTAQARRRRAMVVKLGLPRPGRHVPASELGLASPDRRGQVDELERPHGPARIRARRVSSTPTSPGGRGRDAASMTPHPPSASSSRCGNH
jgi:hypothetical protein